MGTPEASAVTTKGHRVPRAVVSAEPQDGLKVQRPPAQALGTLVKQLHNGSGLPGTLTREPCSHQRPQRSLWSLQVDSQSRLPGWPLAVVGHSIFTIFRTGKGIAVW